MGKLTEEEKKKRKKQYLKLWRAANRERILEQMKQYYAANREQILEQRKQYYDAHKDEIAAQNKLWMAEHKQETADYNAAYFATPMGRARNLIGAYRKKDKLHNRGDCTLTAEWVVDHIFSQPCHYCGESDWTKLGCDRIYNDKPHTEDNVVPCCSACNSKRGTKSYDEFIKQIQKEDPQVN